MYSKQAANYLIGDRLLPLEADKTNDIIFQHPLVGTRVEVSSAANGSFNKGDIGLVKGVYTRFGNVVGLLVSIDGKFHSGSLKDFYVTKSLLEDTCVPTPFTQSIKECVKHFLTQHDYWITHTDGIESFCFEMSSVTDGCMNITTNPHGFMMYGQNTQPQDITKVIGNMQPHNNHYTMNVMVINERQNECSARNNHGYVQDHWMRTYKYTHEIVTGLIEQGYPFQAALNNLNHRIVATTNILQPLLEKNLEKVLTAYQELGLGDKPNIYLKGISIGCSNVRLTPGSIGLNEPPTDRRPYTVISVGADAFDKDIKYVQQIVLHECIHLVVANVHDQQPHNELFNQLAELTGLEEEYRD